MLEVWLPITDVPEGYEGYEVSNLGNIRSPTKLVRHYKGGKSLIKGVILKPRKDKDGYLFISICYEGKQLNTKVHRTVAKYFLPVGEGTEVNHKDFDKTNNVYTNLEWVTRKENQEHASSGGKFTASTNSKRAKKLNTELVSEIIEARKSGLTYAALGAKFGISAPTAFKVVKNEIWQ